MSPSSNEPKNVQDTKAQALAKREREVQEEILACLQRIEIILSLATGLEPKQG